MRRPVSKWLLTALVVAGAAKGSEDGIVVRQLVGIGTSLSDSGFGASAQLSPILVRGTLDVGGSKGPHGYILATLRAGWLHPLSWLGRILVGATGVIPLESTPRDADRVTGQVIGPPHVMVTVLASL